MMYDAQFQMPQKTAIAIKINQKQYINQKKLKNQRQNARSAHLVDCGFKWLQNSLFYYNYKLLQMQKQQKEKKRQINNSESSQNGSEQSNGEEEQNSLNSFIAGDDDSEVEDQYYYPKHRKESDESGQDRGRSKKNKKKKKKKIKKHRIKQDESQLSEGDLDVLEQQEQGGRLNRLKKRSQPKKIKFEDQESEQRDFQVQDDEQGIQSQSGDAGYREVSQEQESRLQQVIGDQGGDIFQPEDQKRYFQQQQDKQIIAMDIPQRYYYQLRNYAKLHNKSIDDVLKIFQSEDRNAEAKWIYARARFNGDERVVREKIKNVLDVLHKDKLEIMFIYYYRRKLYSEVLEKRDLLTIYKLDQQWFTFKEQFNQLNNKVNVIFSFQQMPRLENMLQQTVDIQKLKYFREFESFKLPQTSNMKKNLKNEIISHIEEKGISDWLKKSETFLSPDNLCYNLTNRSGDKKAKNPMLQPRQQLERILRSSNPEADQIKYPLLAPEKRIQTICHYLELQLFAHPEFRQILKEKYYKHLVITTTPSKKGNQDINLYSAYFPVKRIKDKPIRTLNRQIWILACEAERNDLITIELKFQWEPSGSEQRNFDVDTVFKEIIKYYYDVSVHKEGQVWNLFRKQVIMRMLQQYFLPSFFKEIKQELTKQGQQHIIKEACSEFKKKLLILPNRNQKRILAMVLEDKKLGIVFVDEYGQSHSPLQITLTNDRELKQFANDEIIKKYLEDFKPDKICIGANSRRAQTLRTAIRKNTNLPFCALCPYEIPCLVAKQKRLQGSSEQLTVLEAISMARFDINPMTQTLSLWSQNITENGILSLNLHPFQTYVDQRKLKNASEIVAMEVVNLVGIDINDLHEKYNNAGRKALQFVCGFGPRKAFDFYEKIQHEIVANRQKIRDLVSGDILFRNCASFFKVDTEFHKALLEKSQKDKKKEKFPNINLLDSTRIPLEWYSLTQSLTLKAIKSGFDMRQRKIYMNCSEQTIALVQMFKHPQKINSIEWVWKREENPNFDEKLVRQEITSKFKMPSEQRYDFNDEQLFYSLLRETKHTLKRYMIFTVKIISVVSGANNLFLNVVIPQNGLFGSIKIHENKPQYQTGNYIKAIIGNFPFQQSYENRHRQDEKQQELLKVDMLLNFPHKGEQKLHDCFMTCFHQIVKEIHPLIDLDKDRFDLRKEDRPIIQVRDESMRPVKTQFRKISHKKFKNLSVGPAVQLIRNLPIGEFVIRPSSDGAEFLNITWHFFSGVIAHIKVKSEQKSISTSAPVYKIISDKDNKNYQNLDQIIDHYINPMNTLVQDAISNKKFMADPIEKIEQTCKLEMNKEPNIIHYFFGCSPQYPQYFLLVYMYREKKAVKQLIKVRNSGLYFHDQVFGNLKELISWFKIHFKDKQYQNFVKKYSIKK